jgi:hypothetical protein
MTLRFLISLILTAAVFSARHSYAADNAALRITMLEQNIVCLRPARVPEDLAKTLSETQSTNQISGLVLDLRFASGDTNAAPGNVPTGKNVPVVLLVNAQTRGAAADLAVKLRADRRAVIIGDTNVTGKITPDIIVAVNAEEEKSYLENPFTNPAEKTSPTNADLRPFIDHTSEAELVRRQVKDGDDDAADTPRSEPAQPVIRDPALARAVDLLKALAALHKSRG